jgi:uncharacterized protein
MAAAVVDRTDENRFVFAEGDAEAELTYRAEDDKLVLIHTGVPPAFRGRGIAGQLVEAAVDRAVRTGETVVPRCAYARKWLDDHPDVAATITVSDH